MKIEVEISEEDAACIWADHHGDKTPSTIEEIVARILVTEAAKYKRAFPGAVARVVEQFTTRP